MHVAQSCTRPTPAARHCATISAAKSTSYQGGRMQGPSCATMSSGRLPKRSLIARTGHAGRYPVSVPLRPEWTSPITARTGSTRIQRRAVGDVNAQTHVRAIRHEAVHARSAALRATGSGGNDRHGVAVHLLGGDEPPVTKAKIHPARVGGVSSSRASASTRSVTTSTPGTRPTNPWRTGSPHRPRTARQRVPTVMRRPCRWRTGSAVAPRDGRAG